MADAKEKVISMMASVAGVNLNSAADTETALYTVPTGKEFLPFGVRIHSLSADAAAAVVTFGKTGGSCDEFLGDQTLSGLDGTTKTTVCQPVPAATPVAQTILTAGEVFGVEITTPAGGACTCTMEPLGRLRDA
jgi:hypothetical protein